MRLGTTDDRKYNPEDKKPLQDNTNDDKNNDSGEDKAVISPAKQGETLKKIRIKL